ASAALNSSPSARRDNPCNCAAVHFFATRRKVSKEWRFEEHRSVRSFFCPRITLIDANHGRVRTECFWRAGRPRTAFRLTGLVFERDQSVPHRRAILIQMSDKTRGHGSHTIAALWKDELVKLLQESQKQSAAQSGE